MADGVQTIFALSSGLPPAGIAVVRISGPDAAHAFETLAGTLPPARRASLRSLRRSDGVLLDRALTLWIPASESVTGEDLAELHLHGGRAVVDATLAALSALPGLRLAEPGEFTRRALLNGRIDLTEAEGLADLLAAETAAQHRQAMATSGGAVSAAVHGWQSELLMLAAQTEALLDFADEDDVADDGQAIAAIEAHLRDVQRDIAAWLSVPPAERLRDGILVVIAGPPNSGKSTLINAIAGYEAAIVSPIAGTTRDIVEVPLAIGGMPFRFADTAGLRDSSAEDFDQIEAMGIARAQDRMQRADIILWLGPTHDKPVHPAVIHIAAQSDRRCGDPDWPEVVSEADAIVSAVTGDGLPRLLDMVQQLAHRLMPQEGQVALNRRQRQELATVVELLDEAVRYDPLLLAEALRMALQAFDRLTGKAGTEQMLDALFGRFCIGK